jgi:hypothetical protein
VSATSKPVTELGAVEADLIFDPMLPFGRARIDRRQRPLDLPRSARPSTRAGGPTRQGDTMRAFDGTSWTWKIEEQGDQRVDPKGAPQIRHSPQRG